MTRRLLAGFVGALIAFVWSAVIHMNPSTATMGLSMMNEKEDAVLAAVKAAGLPPGLYFFPGRDMSKAGNKAEDDAWMAKFRAGPSGLLLLEPNNSEPMEPKQLLIEFVSDFGCALIAVTILATTVGSVTTRALTVALLGLFAWLALSVSAWDWYRYPFNFILVDLIDQLVGWLLAGFAMAKLIKPVMPATPA
jgi:hypothetical protein